RVSIGVMSIWSRAMQGFRAKGRDLTGGCTGEQLGSALAKRKPAQAPHQCWRARKLRRCAGARMEVAARPPLDPCEVLALDHLAQAVELLVLARPARQLLHVGKPPLNVGIRGKIAADELADGHDAGAEVVGNSDLVAAQVRLRPDPIIV